MLSKLSKVHHTIKNSRDPEKILETAPFFCGRKNSWLSPGFYFWDNNIYWAHKWGENSYGGDYMVCEFTIEISSCLDFIDDDSDIDFYLQLEEIYREDKKIDNNKQIPIGTVIAYARTVATKYNNPAFFPYKSIRAGDQKGQERRNFVEGGREYTLLKVRKQICVFERKDLKLRSISIVHPKEYNSFTKNYEIQ